MPSSASRYAASGREQREAKAREALGLVGLADFAHAYPGELSGGMQQRLALARSIALDVDLLLMDEPLSALDALLREQLQDTLLELWHEEGYAQLLVTHSIDEAVYLGQRIVVLSARPAMWSACSIIPRWARLPIAAAPHITSFATRFAPCCAMHRMLTKTGRRVMRKVLGYVWGTIFVIVLWWVCAALIGSPALPTPAATLPALADNIGKIAPEFMVSLGRILLSMAIGALFGVPLGLWIGRSKRADAIFGPVLYVLYPVPKIVFLPVLFVLFGLGGEGKVVLIAIAVFFQMMVTMRDAAKNVPAGAVESMRSLGASKFAIYRDVIFPATIPDLFTALRITCGTAVAILFIAESMAGSSGLGYYIMHAWSLLEYARMFAGIVAMALMGVLLYEAFDIAERRLTRWRRVA